MSNQSEYDHGSSNDHIFLMSDGSWYFGDEAECTNGPYGTEAEAVAAFKDYFQKLEEEK